MIEKDMRKLAKRMWPKTLAWSEPARGAGEGAADCKIDARRGLRLELELKLWKAGKRGGVLWDIRPSQVRYHRKSAERGIKTALLVGIEEDGWVSIYFVVGANVRTGGEVFVREKDGWYCGRIDDDVPSLRVRIERRIDDENSWRSYGRKK